MEKFKLTFYEGKNSVTGINFLLEGLGKKILVDAGISSGSLSDGTSLRKSHLYNPKDIDFLFVSHADLAHAGKIPLLVKEGFKGTIYSTLETKFILEFLFKDYLESSLKKGTPAYDESDIKNSMKLWKSVYYGDSLDLGDGLTVDMYDAGHMLGSSFYDFNYNDKNILFANSIGGKFVKELSGISSDKNIDYLITESVYGNKVHELQSKRQDYLEDILENTINQRGSVLIPIHSVDKVFVVLQDIKRLLEEGRIPKTPVFVNSVIASKVVSVYGKLFKSSEGGDTLSDFLDDFEGLEFVTDEDRLEEVNKMESKIIISGVDISGEKIYESLIKKYILDPNSTILFLDYQIPESLGKSILEKNSLIKIGKEDFNVVARIESINSYSSHADYNTLFKFVESLKHSLKKVFVVIGEPTTTTFLANKLRDYLGVNTVAVERGDSYELEL